MQSRKNRSQAHAQWLRRHWLLIAVVVIAVITSGLVVARQPLLAADAQPAINQTVPPATPKPTVPNPGDDDDDDNDNNDDNSSTDPGSTAEQAATPLAAAPALASTDALTAVVDVLTLNVRQGPGTSFPVIGKLSQGAAVAVEATNTAGDWWLICCIPGTETRGWVSAALVVPGFAAEQSAGLPVSDSAVDAAPLGATTATTTTATTAAATPVPGSLPGTVAGVNLNVRSGPSTDNPVIAKLRADDVVSVLGRNAAGDWLYICCVGSPAGNGWVSAQFITPAFTTAELEEVAGGSSAVPAATDSAADSAAGGATGDTTESAAGASGGLSVSVAQQPPFAVQGREVALVYTVRNDTASDLADVMLRSELPGPLTLVGASAASGQVAAQDATQNPSLVEITFPVLAAGESATATVRVRVADDVPNGTTFNNFATVTGGAETASTGITIGMPPSLLPEFW